MFLYTYFPTLAIAWIVDLGLLILLNINILSTFKKKIIPGIVNLTVIFNILSLSIASVSQQLPVIYLSVSWENPIRFLPASPGTSVGPSTVIAVKSGRVFWGALVGTEKKQHGNPGRNVMVMLWWFYWMFHWGFYGDLRLISLNLMVTNRDLTKRKKEMLMRCTLRYSNMAWKTISNPGLVPGIAHSDAKPGWHMASLGYLGRICRFDQFLQTVLINGWKEIPSNICWQDMGMGQNPGT